VGFGVAAVNETAKESKESKPKKSATARPAAKQTDRPARPVKQTPFGPVEAKPEEAPPTPELSSDSLVSAEEKGDLVVFRRKTPFGDQVWKKKKSELTPDERKLLARDSEAETQNPPADGETSAKPAPRSQATEKP
jgi:hypothetical protein